MNLKRHWYDLMISVIWTEQRTLQCRNCPRYLPLTLKYVSNPLSLDHSKREPCETLKYWLLTHCAGEILIFSVIQLCIYIICQNWLYSLCLYGKPKSEPQTSSSFVFQLEEQTHTWKNASAFILLCYPEDVDLKWKPGAFRNYGATDTCRGIERLR